MDYDVGSLVPVGAAAIAAVLALIGPRRAEWRSAATVAWVLWAGVVGGALAVTALSGELISTGTGGIAVSALGGLLVALVVAEALGAQAMAGPPGSAGGLVATRHGSRRAPSRAPERRLTRQRVVLRTIPGRLPKPTWHASLVLLGTLLTSLLFAQLGLGLVAVVVLCLAVTAVLACQGWPLVSGFCFSLGVVFAGEVVLGRLVLSPLGVAGDAVPTVAVAWLTLAPVLLMAGHKDVWRRAATAARLTDAAAVIVATTAGLGWWSVFRGLDRADTLTQVVRLGEDNVVHLLLLSVTRATGSVPGAQTGADAAVTQFAGYFAGPSLWQASVGAFLPAVPSHELYVISTAVGLALLAGAVTATAGLAASRNGLLAAAAALAVGLIGVRILLTFFEFGFPGQLLAVLWLVLTLTCLLLPAHQSATQRWTYGGLVLFVAASWWSWSLATPLLLLPLLVAGAVSLWRSGQVTRATAARGCGVLIILVLGAFLALRSDALAILITLNFDGPVFRAIPFWFSYALVLALPVALRLLRRESTLPVATLVLGTGAATLGLAAFQTMSVGMPTYYGYKLQYLLCALGWLAVTILVTAVAAGREAQLHQGWRLVVGLGALAACIPLISWPSTSYQDWLAERQVLGQDVALNCALSTGLDAGPGTSVVAVGFGSPVTDYLTTKALITATLTDRSYGLLLPIIREIPPGDWPWSTLTSGDVLLVSGSAATPAQTEAVRSAAEDAGVDVTLSSACVA